MKSQLLPLSLFFILLFNLIGSNAQTDTTRRTTTVVYSKVEYKRTSKDREIFNLVKINPLLILNGDIPVYFERRIKNQLSVEGGVGVTYNDYIYNGFNLADTDLYDENREYKLGYSVVGSVKFYPSRYTKALDEFYFGPEIRFRKYNSQLSEYSSNDVLLGTYPEHRTLIDFKLMIGYIAYASDFVIFDFYGGVGMRSRDVSFAYLDYSGTGEEIKYDSYKDMAPVLSAGVKIGFGF